MEANSGSWRIMFSGVISVTMAPLCGEPGSVESSRGNESGY
jgi:hypothetical protein